MSFVAGRDIRNKLQVIKDEQHHVTITWRTQDGFLTKCAGKITEIGQDFFTITGMDGRERDVIIQAGVMLEHVGMSPRIRKPLKQVKLYGV